MCDSDKLKGQTGVIFNIQHFCVHDGPGIRTNVFLKGCNFACLWCHNPEGITEERQLSFVGGKCVLCGECARVNPDAHSFSEGYNAIDRSKYTDGLMALSASVCAPKALSVVGEQVTAGEILERVNRDRRYYGESGGGVTFSGGEPTLQKEFLAAALKLVSGDGISTALETNGHCAYSYYESIMPYVDLFLIDYKETDPARHMDFVGAGNELVIENIGRLHDAGAKILLRCLIIPGLNDRDDHFMGIARMTREYPGLLGAEILSYHKLAAAKAGRLGCGRQAEYVQPPPEMVEEWRGRVRSFGGKVYV